MTGEDQDADDYEALIRSLDGERPQSIKLLIEAIRQGNMAVVLENGRVLEGVSTLVLKAEAISVGNSEILSVLLKKDPLIDKDMVFDACTRKDRTIIAMLLDYAWPIDQKIYTYPSLLCTAIDDMDLMQWFIEKGADVNARSINDESALSFAIAHGTWDVVNFLLAQEGIDIIHGNLLHCAAQRENQSEGARLVEHLVKMGANVDAHRFYHPTAVRSRMMFKQPTPLHVAYDKRNVPVAKALLKNGANPHLRMLEAGSLTEEPTPLEEARQMEDQDLLDLLEEAASKFGDSAS